MADNTNETPTADETFPFDASPSRESPEPLYYITGEARVTRNFRRSTRSTRTQPYPNPTGNTSTGTSRPTHDRQWDWLPTLLNTWRYEEDIHTSTDPMDISPYTQEPMHHTVPVLTARVHRHEERLERLEREQYVVQMYWSRQAHDRIAHLHREQEDMAHTLDMIHQQVIDDRGATDLLQARLEECEQRSQEAEEYTRMLEQRLTLAEESARQTGRLAVTMERLVSLMSQMNLRQD